MAKFFIPDGGTEMDSTSYVDDSMVTFRYDGGETPTFLVNGTEFVPDEKWNNDNNDNQIDCVYKYDYINEDDVVEDSIYVSFQDGLPVEVSRDVDEVRSNIEIIRDPDSSTIEYVKYHATNAEIEVRYDKEYGLGYIDVSIDGKQAAIYDNNENAVQYSNEKIEFKAVVVTDDGEVKAYSFVEGDDGMLLLPKEVEYNGNTEFVRDEDRPYTIEAADNFEREYNALKSDEAVKDVENEIPYDTAILSENLNSDSVVGEQEPVDKSNVVETEITNEKGEVVVSIDGETSPSIEINSYDYKTGELRSTNEYYESFHVYTKYENDGTIKSALFSDIDGENSVILATEVYDEDGKCISITYHEERIDSTFETLFPSSDKTDDEKLIEIKEIIDSKTKGEVITAFKDFGIHTYDNKIDSKQEKMGLLKDVVSLSDRLQDAFDNGDRKNADQSVIDDRREIRREIDGIKRDICKIPDDVFKYRVGELQEKIEQLDARVDSVCEKLGLGDKPADVDKETVVERIPLPESLKGVADDALKEKVTSFKKGTMTLGIDDDDDSR